MAKTKRPKGPNLRRRSASRAAKLRVYIFAEGKNTEPAYFKNFAAEHGNSLVKVICDGGEGVPATLVEKARKQKGIVRRSRNSWERNDQTWVIFDRDEHPEVEQSINRALSLGISVGYSNPCFEVWLLLHHQDYDAPDDRHEVQKKFSSADPKYDHAGSKEPDYDLLSSNYDRAKARAIKMRQRRKAENEPKGCPYTDIDLLTEVIVSNGKRRK